MGKYSALNITGVLASLLSAHGVAAADFLSPEPFVDQDVDLSLPAVSGPNGKYEIYLGPTNPGPLSFRAAGSFSLPVGDRFGLQFDGAVQGSGAGTLFGGAVHAFTRDPNSYLLGLTGAVVRGPAGTLGVIGVEGELYLDRVSLEAWAGVGGLNYDDPALADLTGLFAFADAGYYVTDDFRLTLGATHLLGINSLHLGAEYQVRDFQVPFSITGDVRVAHTGAYTVMAGIKGYFGGDPAKSLIARHRQDDPWNRPLSLFTASGALLYAIAPTIPTLVCGVNEELGTGPYAGQCVPSDPEEFSCWVSGGIWNYPVNGECFIGS
jgi:hypothetical protein